MTAVAIEPATARAIGQTIRTARLRLGISKAEAARRAGVSRRTWHEVEEAQRPATQAETLGNFDRALELPDGTLYALTGRSHNEQLERLRAEAIDLVRTLSGPELQAFVESRGKANLLAWMESVSSDIAQLLANSQPPAAPAPINERAPKGPSVRRAV